MGLKTGQIKNLISAFPGMLRAERPFALPSVSAAPSVLLWSDYLNVHLHPKSLYVIRQYLHDGYAQGFGPEPKTGAELCLQRMNKRDKITPLNPLGTVVVWKPLGKVKVSCRTLPALRSWKIGCTSMLRSVITFRFTPYPTSFCFQETFCSR